MMESMLPAAKDFTHVESYLSGTRLAIDLDGAQMYGLVRLTYSVTYYAGAPAAEDVTLDDLATVDAKTSLGGTQAPADQAEDRLENLDAGGV